MRILCAITLLLSIPLALAADLDLPAMAKKIRPSVFLVKVSDGVKEIGLGTGFLVSADGKLITNFHVVDKGTVFTVKSSGGDEYKVENVVSTDANNDIAILKVDCKDMPFLPLGSSTNVEAGTKVVVIGSPLGLAGSLSDGIVSAIRDGPKRWIQMTAVISPGSSGSPVLNAKSEVIGIATATFVEGQGLNVAMPVEAIRALLDAPAGTKIRAEASSTLLAKTPEKGCAYCGAGRGRAEKQADEKWHGYWCQHCADGRALITECFNLMNTLMDNAKGGTGQDPRVVVLKGRIVAVLTKRAQLFSDFEQLQKTGGDVRDLKANKEKALKDTDEEIAKIKREIVALGGKPDEDVTEFVARGPVILNMIKKEMVIMGVTIPDATVRVPVPPFKVTNMDDLLVGARANLDAKARVAAARAADAPRAGKLYILKDGRRITAKIAVELGDEVQIKDDKGKMIKVKKSDIEAVEE